MPLPVNGTSPVGMPAVDPSRYLEVSYAMYPLSAGGQDWWPLWEAQIASQPDLPGLVERVRLAELDSGDHTVYNDWVLTGGLQRVAKPLDPDSARLAMLNAYAPYGLTPELEAVRQELIDAGGKPTVSPG